MPRTHRLTVAIVLLTQVGFLAGMIGLHEYRSHNWQKVRLLTEPVDPVSLFRGRYVPWGMPSTPWQRATRPGCQGMRS